MSEPTKSDTKPKPKPKGWSNPALKAMGIPRISLPSRNWLIFWSVLAGIGGAALYDRQRQKQIRQKYTSSVESAGQEIYDSTRLPRKLTVFVAPPPNDFLETSMKYFRKYIKPVLNSAAIDFDILVANKQGDIRTSVSERIRQLRRDQNKPKDQKPVPTTNILTPFKQRTIDDEETKSYHELYEAKDIVGFYYNNKPITPVKDDSLDPEKAGGVVCIGRGAYKEFIQGVHEGLLGPLEQPIIEQPVQEITEEQPKEEPPKEEKPKEEQSIPPYINPADYSNSELAPELNLDGLLKDKSGVPVFFQQPIYVFPVPNILGFMNMPKKIYGFFTKRYVAEEFSERTLTIVNNNSRPFEYKDQFLGKEEELLWPKNWVKTGKAKNSEWTQELVIDDRVIKLLRVFD